MHFVYPHVFLQEGEKKTLYSTVNGSVMVMYKLIHCFESAEVGRISRQNQGSCFSSWVSRAKDLGTADDVRAQPTCSFVLSGEEHKRREASLLIGEKDEGAEL